MRISEQVRNPHLICVPDSYLLLSIIVNRFHLLLCQSLIEHSDLVKTTGKVTCPTLGPGACRQTWVGHEMYGTKDHRTSISKSHGAVPSGRHGGHRNSIDIVYELFRGSIIGQYMVCPLAKEVCYTRHLDP